MNKKITVRLTEEIEAELEYLVSLTGSSVSDIVRDAIDEYYKNY